MAAALLTACGGDDSAVPASGQPSGAPTTPGTFSAVVGFGDSLSDVGAYAPATSLDGSGGAPYFGGKFTTNGASGTVWVENVATRLGVVTTPAEVGFGATSFKCPAAAIQTDAAAGRISADEANRRLFVVQTTAQAELKRAALELAGYVRTEILAKGGRYVAVFNLPDSTLTPFGSTLPPSAKPVLSALVDTFNLWLQDGLTDVAVKIIDQNTPGKDVYARPAAYGIVNNAVPACDATAIAAITGGAVTDGSSLFCNSTVGAPYYGLRAGASTTTWQFADGVHPTPGGHRIISDYVLAQLRSFGWIAL